MRKEEHCLRVGILGCGPISQFAHLESAQKARNVVLRAVCDADESLARRFGTFYDAERIYLDYDEMLNDESLDAAMSRPLVRRLLRASTCCVRSPWG